MYGRRNTKNINTYKWLGYCIFSIWYYFCCISIFIIISIISAILAIAFGIVAMKKGDKGLGKNWFNNRSSIFNCYIFTIFISRRIRCFTFLYT